MEEEELPQIVVTRLGYVCLALRRIRSLRKGRWQVPRLGVSKVVFYEKNVTSNQLSDI